VIEHHSHSPKRVLEEIRRVLKPGGCVIISTPNQASIYNRITILTGGSVADPFDYFLIARQR
jgi:2-polyprenyl-3-methyl-5-hydroxy-6-metoxy-1,4-benzoquinol methylase